MDGPEHVDCMSQEDWGRWFARRGRLDVALLLFAIWDPVGVNDVPEAYDEYDTYAADCLRSIAEGDVQKLAAVLAGIEGSQMGHGTPASKLAETAEMILQGARASAQRWLRSH